MCGIAGIYSLGKKPVPKKLLLKMSQSIKHRGPDDDGLFLEGPIGMINRRLSIIDLTPSGHQPMANEDGSIWISYNGEIYNFRDLRKKLEAKGHRFSSRSDTEVVLHSYEETGARCLQSLRGMFAFSIWDKRKNQLLLARDRIGEKPLFYTKIDDFFLWASEIKAILATGLVRPRLDLESLNHFLTFSAVPEPLTMFSDIKNLPRAHYAVVKGRQYYEKAYWRLSFTPNKDESKEKHLQKFKNNLYRTVNDEMRADVPVGVFLSGGIDSSSLTAIAQRSSRLPLETFSLLYKELDLGEAKVARLVAQTFRANHHEYTVSWPDVHKELNKVIWHLEQPPGNPIFGYYFLAKEARKKVKVVMAGAGPDEIFSGYGLPQVFRLVEPLAKILHLFPLSQLITEKISQLPLESSFPRKVRTLSGVVGGKTFLDRYTRMIFAYQDSEKIDSLYRPEIEEKLREVSTVDFLGSSMKEAENLPLEDKIAYLIMNYNLTNNQLPYIDRLSMAFGLEVRSPYLDHRIIEQVASIPSEIRTPKNAPAKTFLKEAVSDILPEKVMRKKKTGFGLPTEEYLKRHFAHFHREFLTEEVMKERGIFSYKAVKQLIQGFERNKERLYWMEHLERKIWLLIAFEAWARVFLDHKASFPES